MNQQMNSSEYVNPKQILKESITEINEVMGDPSYAQNNPAVLASYMEVKTTGSAVNKVGEVIDMVVDRYFTGNNRYYRTHTDIIRKPELHISFLETTSEEKLNAVEDVVNEVVVASEFGKYLRTLSGQNKIVFELHQSVDRVLVLNMVIEAIDEANIDGATVTLS